MEKKKLSRYVGVSLLAASTLMAEVVLVRVFEVLMQANFAYLIVTAALFAFGVAGVYSTLRPARHPHRTSVPAIMLAVSLLALTPLLNAIPFDYDQLVAQPIVQLTSFAILYVALALPFFCAGLVLARLFTRHADDIRRLYAWDLLGAALGSVAPLPLLSVLGPSGLLILAAGIALLSAAFLAEGSVRKRLLLLSVPVLLTPLVLGPERLALEEHSDKRGLKTARELGLVEYTQWDPVAKIDVLSPLTIPWAPAESDPTLRPRRQIVYDGGSQSSYYYGFAGNFEALRDSIERRLIPPEYHFWFWGVLASHSLKRDSDQRVAVIGSAGGQEIKAALMYGARRVDGVELVGLVTELGETTYADYTGRLFLDPRVNMVRGEGRSYLRSVDDTFDIIQIFSNHTASNLAQGAGAISADYLNTREAYVEHFRRLDPNGGILHLNHHMYPRIVTTAAAAWAELGRTDFERHVFVAQRARVPDNLATILIKMTPWTSKEVEHLEGLMELSPGNFVVVERPGDPADGFLPPEFFLGELDGELLRQTPYRVQPATDDRPYFNFVRKSLGTLEVDEEHAVDRSVAAYVNLPLRKGIPLDVAHLFIVAGLSLLLAFAFVGVPLARSPAGRAAWPGKTAMLTYFALLGAGFITVELTLLSLLIKVIGFPLHTFALVVFVLLAGAGMGSALAARLRVNPNRHWQHPFVAVVVLGLAFIGLYDVWSPLVLGEPAGVRAAIAAVAILPLGVALGMPFPLGILWAKERHEGAVAWGWGMNGLFTAAGGVGSSLMALFFGLRFTFVFALVLYAVAFAMFAAMRKAATAPRPTTSG